MQMPTTRISSSTTAADGPVLPAGLGRLVILVRGLAVVGALALLLVPPLFWATPSWLRQAGAAAAGLDSSQVTIDAQAQWLGLMGSLPGVALGLWAVWQLWCLFGEFGAGRIFGLAAQRRLAALARGLLAMALWGPLQRTVIGLALTWGNPPGQRMLVLGIGMEDYLALVSGAVLLATATVMAEAARLADENAGFV
jgi:hypothetical protein